MEFFLNIQYGRHFHHFGSHIGFLWCVLKPDSLPVFQFWFQGLYFDRYDGEKCDDTVYYFTPGFRFGIE